MSIVAHLATLREESSLPDLHKMPTIAKPAAHLEWSSNRSAQHRTPQDLLGRSPPRLSGSTRW
eukprot:141349-Pyramimonas_sp.AAC.1